MVMVRNLKPYKWFIYGYGLVGQNIRPCTPLVPVNEHPTNKAIINDLDTGNFRFEIIRVNPICQTYI